MSDSKKTQVRPKPDQVFPANTPVVAQGMEPPQQSGRLLNRPSEPLPKLSPGTSQKSLEKKKHTQMPGERKKKALSDLGAIAKYGHLLTEHEKREIIGYSEVWCLGLRATKNETFDDPDGFYRMVEHDHIAYRYEMLRVMGQGSFGQVLRCWDHKTNEMVAIKILRRLKGKLGLTEVKILKALRKKEKSTSTSTVQMKNFFNFRNHFCIVFEIMGSNLDDILDQQHRQGFSKQLVLQYARSMLKCLLVLHDEKIIHADLKPENILAIDKEHSDIKVADFGCGCFEDEQVYNYFGTRWYRAPELLIEYPYSTAIDMWSFGCVVAELHTGRPIFTGENVLDQLCCIMEVLGMPDEKEKSEFCTAFFAHKWNLKTAANPKARPLASILGHSDPYFLNFVRRCLTSNLDDILDQQHRQGFSKKLICHYARSMLKCLLVLHDEKIIHADLKPENILAIDKEHSDIKVADFGCGCYEDEQVYSYFGTRWYRAPELLIEHPYSTAIDMWSFGCVVAELHTGRPIFTGKNVLDQLCCIMEVLGMPDEKETSEFWTAFFAHKWKLKTAAKLKARPLASILGHSDPDFLDFVRRCLTWDPKMRMTPQEAMQHKWIME